MNPQQIDALVESSLSGPRHVYTHHVPNPVEYLATVQSRFLEKRIHPERRAVVIEPHVADHLGLPVGEHSVFFVSDDDPQSVFFDPATNLFGCAWGPRLPNLDYVDLGFRSEDVLEMASA